mmetsp:Transcript_32402/g.82789  ORF Transcript_32402/g.82789 Transcript_32402/m.82789 type:complete len:108 (+) Transcript_32402:116-439(+)|eukprot:jgi/Tetstr1/425080/TSEL_015544.t1
MECSAPCFDLPSTVSGRKESACSDQDSSCAFDWYPMAADDSSPAPASITCLDDSVKSLTQLKRAGLEKLNAMLRQGATQQELAVVARDINGLRPATFQTYRDLSLVQ